MAALFPRWSNLALRLGLCGAALTLLGIPVFLMWYVRTPWITDELDAVDQPVEFDHRHHVVDDEIECLYCHRDAERSSFAGVPETEVCMGCHVQVWNESPLLLPVRLSMASGQPIPWKRVHQLADFVYFDHSVHVRRGIGCVVCHGRVDHMARVYKVSWMRMQWCLDCHRNPRTTLDHSAQWSAERPGAENGFSSLWGASRGELEPQLTDTGHAVTSLTTCSACHR